MRQGPKPAKSKEAKPPVGRKSPKSDGARVRDLEKRLAEALKLKTEALQREAEALEREAVAQEQQAATAEILRVISSSPSDAQPAFDAIAASAMRLFRAWSVVVYRYDGELIQLGATRAPSLRAHWGGRSWSARCSMRPTCGRAPTRKPVKRPGREGSGRSWPPPCFATASRSA
jgi:hypothetical protein